MNNSAANEDDDEGSEDGYPAPRDFGVGGVNRTCARPTSNLCGYAAIHLAIQEGHEVKIFMELAKSHKGLVMPYSFWSIVPMLQFQIQLLFH